MLQLEFHVNQGGLQRHHWATSSRLTAAPLANQSKGELTSLRCDSWLLWWQVCEAEHVSGVERERAGSASGRVLAQSGIFKRTERRSISCSYFAPISLRSPRVWSMLSQAWPRIHLSFTVINRLFSFKTWLNNGVQKVLQKRKREIIQVYY